MKQPYLETILRAAQTVFSLKDIAVLWREAGGEQTHTRLHYYLKQGRLIHLRQGLYAKDKNYDQLELGTKVYTPAYISFETVLRQAGFIFQHYDSIFVASYLSREIICNNKTYV